jgi:hypothetical protein
MTDANKHDPKEATTSLMAGCLTTIVGGIAGGFLEESGDYMRYTALSPALIYNKPCTKITVDSLYSAACSSASYLVFYSPTFV